MQNAHRTTSKPFDASAWNVAIVTAQFNRHITDAALQSALSAAADYHLPSANITTIKVAGAVEIPLALQRLARTGKYKALLAIGCIIKGDTPHFDYVCKLVTEGILRVQLDWKIPVGFGILTCDTEAQALSRTKLAGEHLAAALQLAKTLDDIDL